MNETSMIGGAGKDGGLPSLRVVDHVGITGSDIEQATMFVVEVHGCGLLYELGPDDAPQEALGTPASSRIKKVRSLRCVAILAAPAAAIAGASRPAYAAPLGMTFAALATLATLWAWFSGGGTVDVAWVPNWGLPFTLSLDGLATLYALLATGLGFAVLVYS